MDESQVHCLAGDTAYVADLDLAISNFVDPLSDSDEVLTLIKLYTARQVVNARVSSYSDAALRVLVWLNRKEEAIAAARLRGDSEDTFTGLFTVYNTLRERAQLDSSLLAKTQEVAKAIEDSYSRVVALGKVAVALAWAGRDDQAKALFNEAQQ